MLFVHVKSYFTSTYSVKQITSSIKQTGKHHTFSWSASTDKSFCFSSTGDGEKIVTKWGRSRLWQQKQGIYSEKGKFTPLSYVSVGNCTNLHRREWKVEIWSHFMGNRWSVHTCQDISPNSISTVLLGFALPLVFMRYFKWKFTKGSALRVEDNLFKCYVLK